MILNHTAPNVEPSILDGCEVPLRNFVFVYTYNAYNCIPAKYLLLILVNPLVRKITLTRINVHVII